MPKFPKKESQILQLANQMYSGYTAHVADFPSVPWWTLITKRFFYNSARDAQVNAVAQNHLATIAKTESLLKLTQLMKGYLKRSEVDTADNPEKLAEIGWAPKASPRSSFLPTAPRDLKIETQERTTVKLSWERPAESRNVRNYIIERRDAHRGGEFTNWQLVTIAYKRQITLDRQPTGIMLEYRVKAVNTSGQSPASNTTSVVL